MIKAEDLRIGDLVNFHNSPCIITGIDDISCTVGLLNTNNSEDFRRVDDINIDPIPLTTEILEKNGFEMREGTVVYAKNRLALKPLDEGKGYQVYQIGLGSLRLFYVEVRFVKYAHELQHILWALGKDANLKV